MITIFNRKKLLLDNSAEEAAKAAEILKANGVPYEMQTKRSRGVVGTTMDSMAYKQFNQAFSTDSQKYEYYYILYVRGKDYQRGRELLHI